MVCPLIPMHHDTSPVHENSIPFDSYRVGPEWTRRSLVLCHSEYHTG
jgi:hypothetical protein